MVTFGWRVHSSSGLRWLLTLLKSLLNTICLEIAVSVSLFNELFTISGDSLTFSHLQN